LFLFLIVTFVALLKSKEWSLADTVSEEAYPQPAALPANGEGKPIMVASTSRLVALMRLLGILSMFLGVGYYILWSHLAKTQSLSFGRLSASSTAAPRCSLHT
jgi:hypothetical protein